MNASETSAAPLSVVMVAACPFPANHGSAASIREMSEALADLGHEVHIVTYPIHEDIPIAGVTVHRVNAPFIKPGAVRIGPSVDKLVYDFLLVFKLLKVIYKHKIDVIHAHNYEAAMIGWVGKFLGRRPLLYNAVTNMKDELPTYDFIKPRKAAELLGRALDYVVPRTANVITVVSDELKDYLAQGGVSKNLIKVVPAGVNLEMFEQADGAKIRERHGLSGVPLVMYTGAFEQFQRIDYLLQAMQWVVGKNPGAHLMLVGNVKNAANLKKYIDMTQVLGIDKQVTFLDSVPLVELADYLAAADVTVVPRTECPGHPVKLLNYMAAGKPIVSFIGGAKGLHHMHNGYLAQDHDCEALGRGIDFLLKRPDVAQALGERARQTIRDTFDWRTLARGIELIYRQITNGRDKSQEAGANPYLKESYILNYVERRTGQVRPKQRGRIKVDRRTSNAAIDFLERRKVVFAIAASPTVNA